MIIENFNIDFSTFLHIYIYIYIYIYEKKRKKRQEHITPGKNREISYLEDLHLAFFI